MWCPAEMTTAQVVSACSKSPLLPLDRIPIILIKFQLLAWHALVAGNARGIPLLIVSRI